MMFDCLNSCKVKLVNIGQLDLKEFEGIQIILGLIRNTKDLLRIQGNLEKFIGPCRSYVIDPPQWRRKDQNIGGANEFFLRHLPSIQKYWGC